MRVLSVQGTLRFLKILKLTRILSIQEKRALYSLLLWDLEKIIPNKFYWHRNDTGGCRLRSVGES